MSTLTVHQPARPSRPADQIYGTLRAEWIKFRSLRSNRAALVTAFVAILALGIVVCAVTVSGWDHASARDRASFDPVAGALTGGALAQLIIGIVGILMVSAEFSSGTARSTFAAVPDRRMVLGSKAAVLVAITFTMSLASSLIAFIAGQHILAGKHVNVSFSDPGVTRAVIGGALYLTVSGLLGLGIASIVRHTAASIGTLLGVLLVVPSLVGFLPVSTEHTVGRYLPSGAGSAVVKVHPDPWDMAPWTGIALFAGYAIATLVIGAIALRRRDI